MTEATQALLALIILASIIAGIFRSVYCWEVPKKFRVIQVSFVRDYSEDAQVSYFIQKKYLWWWFNCENIPVRHSDGELFFRRVKEYKTLEEAQKNVDIAIASVNKTNRMVVPL